MADAFGISRELELEKTMTRRIVFGALALAFLAGWVCEGSAPRKPQKLHFKQEIVPVETEKVVRT